MATHNVVIVPNLGLEFDLGTLTANKIRLKLDTTLTRAATGEIGVDINNLSVVSGDAGNVIATGGDGGAFFDQAALQAIETVWAGTEASGFMTITPGGTNAHAPVFAFDYSNAAFVEGVQDAVGQAILAGSGITYDDVADSISSALGSLVQGDGIAITGGNTIAVQPDPASPSPVAVSVAGVSVTPGISTDAGNLAALGTDNKVMVNPAGVTALATDVVCDAFGVDLFDAFPT